MGLVICFVNTNGPILRKAHAGWLHQCLGMMPVIFVLITALPKWKQAVQSKHEVSSCSFQLLVLGQAFGDDCLPPESGTDDPKTGLRRSRKGLLL